MAGAERPLPCRACESGRASTEAEKTELVTLPAIRAFMVPPFWAKGSV